MNAQCLATNAQNTRPTGVGSDVPEEIGKNVPTLDEIHRRALAPLLLVSRQPAV
jgi:hypothetical protein